MELYARGTTGRVSFRLFLETPSYKVKPSIGWGSNCTTADMHKICVNAYLSTTADRKLYLSMLLNVASVALFDQLMRSQKSCNEAHMHADQQHQRTCMYVSTQQNDHQRTCMYVYTQQNAHLHVRLHATERY